MKLSIKKFASLALLAAAFLLGPVLNASASSCSYPTWLKSYLSCYSKSRCGYYSSYYCNSYNYQYNCKKVTGNNNCGSGTSTGGTTTPPVVTTGSISITPIGTIVGIGTTISIVAPYTAPANSTAQVTLYEDEVPIAVYVIPGTSTSGNATFSIAVPSFLDVSVFQAQLTYTTIPAPTSNSNDCHGRRHKYDDDCGRSSHHYKNGRSCDDDDDDDDDGGTPVTTVLSSEFLIVVKAGGGGGQSG